MFLSLCFSRTSRGTPSRCPPAPSYLEVSLNPRERERGCPHTRKNPAAACLFTQQSRPGHGRGFETCSSPSQPLGWAALLCSLCLLKNPNPSLASALFWTVYRQFSSCLHHSSRRRQRLVSDVTHRDPGHQKEARTCQDPRSQLSGEEQGAPRRDTHPGRMSLQPLSSPEVPEVQSPHL